MATATSDRSEPRARRRTGRSAAAVAVLVALLAAGAVAAAINSHRSAAPAPSGAFGWLRPAAAPSSWKQVSTPSGATLSYPPGWHTIRTDPGTVSAAPNGTDGVFRGYLNATPQSGTETLANWRRFRVAHVADEGARDVRLAVAGTGLRFRAGHGSCVMDSYSTSRTRFREIACIVAGRRGTTVVVAAAPVSRWAGQAQTLERAIASFET